MRAYPGRMTAMICAATGLAFVAARLFLSPDVAAYLGGFIPARVAAPDLLDRAGLPFSAVPMLLTPLTATLLHGNWMHLLFNLLMLVYCGRQVEMVVGGRLLLLLYGIGAYAAALGQWAVDPSLPIPMIGASGAISALVGAYALLFGNREVRAIGPFPPGIVRMLWLGAGWTVLQLMVGVAMDSGGGEGLGVGGASGIAIGAHIGGFLAGMLLTRPLLWARFGRRVLED